MKQQIMTYISSQNVKRIHTENIEQYLIGKMKDNYYDQGGYETFVKAINELVKEEKLKPIKSWKKNSLYPPLYNGYQQIQKEMNKEEIANRLLTYDPGLSTVYYMKYPNQFEKDVRYIEAVSRFFSRKRKETPYVLSINERSFELFQDEKFLLTEDGQLFLKRVHVTYEDLCCYPTYEPFFYYKRETPLDGMVSILIVENKDTFDTFKKLFQEGKYTWKGTSFDWLIYGEGKKILRSISFLEEISELQNKTCTLFYFGDIDPIGLWICSSLAEKQTYPCQPFTPFYEHLLDKFHDVQLKQKKEHKVNHSSFDSFFSFFSSTYTSSIQRLFEHECYLPQEGLNRGDLNQMWREEHGQV